MGLTQLINFQNYSNATGSSLWLCRTSLVGRQNERDTSKLQRSATICPLLIQRHASKPVRIGTCKPASRFSKRRSYNSDADTVMWRRVTSLSQTLYPSRSTLLDQGAYGFTIWRSVSTRKNLYIAFVLGGPGSGKGTQCEKIAETFGFMHLSAGDMLRREIQAQTEYGDMILNKIRNGKIVPSEVTVKLIQRELQSSENSKFLIDGFPRSEENHVSFERIIGVEPNMVLFFDCPEEEMIKRVLGRNQARDDDNIETMKKRLRIFQALSLPVVNYYAKKGKLHKISAVGTVEKVHPIFAALQGN